MNRVDDLSVFPDEADVLHMQIHWAMLTPVVVAFNSRKVGQKWHGWPCCLPVLSGNRSVIAELICRPSAVSRELAVVCWWLFYLLTAAKIKRRSAQREANRTGDLHLDIIECLFEMQFISGRCFKSAWDDESWAIGGVAGNQPWLIALLRDRKVWRAAWSASLN